MVSPLDMPPAPTPPVHNMASTGERSTGLLNLLKFSTTQAAHAEHQPQGPPGFGYQHHNHLQHQVPHQVSQHNAYASEPRQAQPQPPQHILAPAPTSGDPSGLLAALLRGAKDSEEPATPEPTPPIAPSSFGQGPPTADTRAFLLNMLSRPKPSQDDPPILSEDQNSRPSNITPQSTDLGDGSRHNSQTNKPTPGSSHSHTAISPPIPRMVSGSYEYENRFPSQPSQGYDAYDMPAAPDVPGSQQYNFPSGGFSGPGTFGGHDESPYPGQYGLSQQDTSPMPLSGPFQILKKSQPASMESYGAPHHQADRSDLDREIQAPSRDASQYSAGIDETTHVSARNAYDVSPSTTGIDPAKEPEDEAPNGGDASGPVRQTDGDDDQGEETRPAAVATSGSPQHVDGSNSHEADPEPKRSAPAGEGQANGGDSDRSGSDDSPLQNTKESLDSRQDEKNDVSQEVADSWESADAEEVVVVDDSVPAPVRVYNFPLQPWISITLQDGATEPRAELADASIMDIARLKKDFDQVDRNLYTATQRYMAYGMSKAGGLRVIRQEDGKDSKMFGDTKDRIFNVSMSVTPSDGDGLTREAILGTGISGTVYWVQIRQGEKDHLEDAHPEQYGFALPPLASQDGDAPGGVLKTRARVSSCHPEYFAVGRGKSINIIWPAFVIQNNLLKPGHDRVVDTEKLAQQCSLKINTGKAGKDFTFSPDDSVIVSLDKSGRVKFWDVRDLTARDPQDPTGLLPQNTFLEVKDPLMTLASTPDGEKAWPTSVLLLDKLKPYQKRCALRYMIVGMKQNHTLQLWDLALGRPVQEFNLPHSKESDAVCSVVYHPATGMIVIGHPTRNSIYLAHLSAPKYVYKSISQADYIARLSAKDTSIPPPESTAVISGFREYSFDNRGILRSLDILGTPAMAQDGEEPTLFELYVMHSKGVACLLFRHAELGWAKDTNKVLLSGDAVQAGVATVVTLKPIATQQLIEESIQARQSSQVPQKETPQPQAVLTKEDPTPRKAPETPSGKAKLEKRETETPTALNNANSGNNSNANSNAERPEKKSRKKKNAGPGEDKPNGASTPAKSNALASKAAEPSAKGPVAQKATAAAAAAAVSQEAIDSTIKSVESRIVNNVTSVFSSSLRVLSDHMDETLRVRDEDFESRQVKLLDVVSEVLTGNTQKVMREIVREQFTTAVAPPLVDAATRAMTEHMNTTTKAHIQNVIRREFQGSSAQIAEDLIQNRGFVSSLSRQISAEVQEELSQALAAQLMPSLTSVVVQATQRVAGDMQQQYQEEIDRLQADRAAQANKVDQLLSLVTRLTDTVSSMASGQTRFQAELLKIREAVGSGERAVPQHSMPSAPSAGSSMHSPAQHMKTQLGPSPHSGPPMAHTSPQLVGRQGPQHQAPQHQGLQHQGIPQVPVQHGMQQPMPQGMHSGLFGTGPHGDSPQGNPGFPRHRVNMDGELEQHLLVIQNAMKEGKLEDAIIRWIQSGREEDIFAELWSKLSPVHLRDLPPLVLLSVATIVSRDLDSPLLREKAAWLEMAVHCLYNSVPSFDAQIQEVTPKIMNLILSRVETMYMRLSSANPHDGMLKSVSQLLETTRQIIQASNPAAHGQRYH